MTTLEIVWHSMIVNAIFGFLLYRHFAFKDKADFYFWIRSCPGFLGLVFALSVWPVFLIIRFYLRFKK
jgi:hypothetical protein